MERRRTPPDADQTLRAERLAELVAELTGTEATTALQAVRESATPRRRGDALGVVAKAMVHVDQPPAARLRRTGYLRSDDTEG